jgi:hypothetical protein
VAATAGLLRGERPRHATRDIDPDI